ncbi:MAG TPA: crotonase/enoyl-CoA hydratase family protein [Blastocatellia bacterium]|nr:crotonase/enoyl-CoA hydratase family protein [Blastocatellia bacterium]
MRYEHLDVSCQGSIARICLDRPEKHNALSETLINSLDSAFSSFTDEIRVVILTGNGEHFCAGLDLSEASVKSPVELLRTSQRWHTVFHSIQFSSRPVVSLLKGGVIGGGLELALASHVRVVESNAFFQLPEAQRGFFVGGGASVRVSRVIGPDRMTEMMLTGRRYDAADGYRLGLAHYLADEGEGMDLVDTLAEQIASNAPLSTWAAINAVPRIHDMSMSDGLFAESLTAAFTQSSPEALERMATFLNRKSR